MCIFCDKIYENETELNNAVHNAWVNDEPILESAFVKTEQGIILVTVDADISHNHRLYGGVKFCPYCGRNLNEKI